MLRSELLGDIAGRIAVQVDHLVPDEARLGTNVSRGGYYHVG